MKLLRVGNKGNEKPAVLDKEGKIRDISSHISCLLYTSPSPRD